jgi:hypothetical protein
VEVGCCLKPSHRGEGRADDQGLPAGPARQPLKPASPLPTFLQHSGPSKATNIPAIFENSPAPSTIDGLTQNTTPIEEILLEDGQNVQDYRR